MQPVEQERASASLRYLIPHFPPWSLPLIVRGRGTTVWDSEGKEYIDCHGGPGVSSVGHAHPELVAAIKEQAEKIMVSPDRLLHEPLLELAVELGQIVPNPLKRSFFCNSGTEAVEASVKFAKKYSFSKGKTGNCLVSLENAFHGVNALSSTLTAQGRLRKGLANFATYPSVVHIPS